MMISPEEFYNESLKGKSTDQIMRVICSLKRKMGRLKNIVEHPHYEPQMCPSERTQLFCTREYLERAQMALKEAGDTYTPSVAEQKALDFDANIPNISKIKFFIGGFFAINENITYTFEDNKVHVESENSLYEPYLEETHILDLSKEEFLEEIRNLHLGEWRKRYDTKRFGYIVCDGIQWELEIYFSNDHKPVKIYGDNAYPYNFDSLLDLFGFEDEI